MGSWLAEVERPTNESDSGTRSLADPCSALTLDLRCATWLGQSTPANWYVSPDACYIVIKCNWISIERWIQLLYDAQILVVDFT